MPKFGGTFCFATTVIPIYKNRRLSSTLSRSIRSHVANLSPRIPSTSISRRNTPNAQSKYRVGTVSPRQPLRVDNILPEDNSSGQKHVRPAPRSRGYQSNGRGYLDVIQRNRIGEWTSLLRPVRGSNIATGIYLDVARSRGDQGEGEGRGGGMQRTCIGRRRRRCE